jgi:hypothetical protein
MMSSNEAMTRGNCFSVLLRQCRAQGNLHEPCEHFAAILVYCNRHVTKTEGATHLCLHCSY